MCFIGGSLTDHVPDVAASEVLFRTASIFKMKLVCSIVDELTADDKPISILLLLNDFANFSKSSSSTPSSGLIEKYCRNFTLIIKKKQ